MPEFIQFKKLSSLAILPRYMTEGAAGADLFAALTEPLIITPGQTVLVPTGLALQIPPHLEVQIRPRSGLSLKSGLILPNSPGTIDSDYRGELKIIMTNIADRPFTIHHADRIAQMIVAPIVRPTLQWVDELDPTPRGEGGFGSTSI